MRYDFYITRLSKKFSEICESFAVKHKLTIKQIYMNVLQIVIFKCMVLDELTNRLNLGNNN